MPEELLVKQFGDPLNTYYRDNGDVIYEYIERFQLGLTQKRIVEAKRYYFTAKNGKIISKRIVVKNQPFFEPMNEL